MIVKPICLILGPTMSFWSVGFCSDFVRTWELQFNFKFTFNWVTARYTFVCKVIAAEPFHHKPGAIGIVRMCTMCESRRKPMAEISCSQKPRASQKCMLSYIIFGPGPVKP